MSFVTACGRLRAHRLPFALACLVAIALSFPSHAFGTPSLTAEKADQISHHGFHMSSRVNLSRDAARVDGTTRVWTTSWALGFTGGVVVWFVDRDGNVLQMLYPKDIDPDGVWGVDAKSVFWSRSDHTNTWAASVSRKVAEETEQIVILHTHEPKVRFWSLVSSALDTGCGVLSVITPFFPGAAQYLDSCNRALETARGRAAAEAEANRRAEEHRREEQQRQAEEQRRQAEEQQRREAEEADHDARLHEEIRAAEAEAQRQEQQRQAADRARRRAEDLARLERLRARGSSESTADEVGQPLIARLRVASRVRLDRVRRGAFRVTVRASRGAASVTLRMFRLTASGRRGRVVSRTVIPNSHRRTVPLRPRGRVTTGRYVVVGTARDAAGLTSPAVERRVRVIN